MMVKKYVCFLPSHTEVGDKGSDKTIPITENKNNLTIYNNLKQLFLHVHEVVVFFLSAIMLMIFVFQSTLFYDQQL